MKLYKPFQFKQFSITQNNAAMKVGTDSVLLGAWTNLRPKERVLDIGTGTGLLSLMLAQKVDGDCSIDAVEIDADAIRDAQINFNNSNWNKSIHLHNIDFNNYNSKLLYDVIISNPPFFEGLAPKNLSRSIARNATDKLSYNNLISKAAKLLNTNGRIYLIVPIEYYDKVIEISSNNLLHLNAQVNIKPKTHKPINRVLIELIKTNPLTSIKIDTLLIRNNNNQYTKEHTLFTEDYYPKRYS